MLLDRDIKTIGKHINTIFEEQLLDINSTCAKFATVQTEGSREIKKEIEHYKNI